MTSPPPGDREQEVRELLHEFVSGDRFSCVGAKMALQRRSLRHRHYRRMADPAETRHLYDDLRHFAEHRNEIDQHFATFIATFDEPRTHDEFAFETLLWSQLQLVHDLDGDVPAWHPNFDSSPESERFGFCVSGHPFFVVGLHGGASRLSRRFAYPALAFNSHEQFDRLFRMGVFRRLRSEIRRRELELQGSVNPSFVDYPGQESRQYAGRETETDWICPFRPRIAATAAPQETAANPEPDTSATASAPTRQVRCANTKIVMIWTDGTSLLDVCEDYGLPVEGLCRSGVCGRCAVRLRAGNVGYQIPSLEEPPPDHILLCIAEPQTDVELDL